MNLSEQIISKLTEESRNLPNFVAPLTHRRAKIMVLINNHPYVFKTNAMSFGWFAFHPIDSSHAEIIRPAHISEKTILLNECKKAYLIAIKHVSDQCWLCMPHNISDFKQRGLPVNSILCHFIDINIEPFTTISARIWGEDFIFDNEIFAVAPKIMLDSIAKNEPRFGAKSLSAELKIAYQIALEEISKQKKLTTEGKIEDAIAFLGAKLVGFSERGEGYSVSYIDNGRTYQVSVDKHFRLLSAGICLSNREVEQTLASTVAVMRRQNRQWDYDNEDDD